MSPTQTLRSTASRLAAFGGLLCLLLLPTALFGQGCVVARGGGANAITGDEGYLDKGHWEIGFAYRHFLSSRHFVGDDEQYQREVLHNEVINHSNFFDVTATYAYTKRWTFTATLPFLWSDRSQVANGVRIHTQASGLGDVRVGTDVWVLDPNAPHRGNFSVGVGLKLPTGDSTVQDYFARPVNPSVGYVDSSIQPGDGAVGEYVEMQGFYRLAGNFSLYGNGFYLFNPAEMNETTGWSIPDGYMVRGGIAYAMSKVRGVQSAVDGLGFSLGLRNEGVVAHDLFGGNLGRRRPGFAVSVEPGISYSYKRYVGTVTVPVAIHRNRVPSYGTNGGGDAAFADYTVNLSFTIRL